MKTVASIFALALVLSLSMAALADNCEDSHDGALTAPTNPVTVVTSDTSDTKDGTSN